MKGTPHRKRVRHFEGFGHLHELTFSCYQRRSLLTNDSWCRILSEKLAAACQEEAFGLVAFVFMPEHIHLLVVPLDGHSKISRLLGRTKQPTSKAIKKLLVEQSALLLKTLTVRERPGKYCFRFWQEGPGFDRNIFSAQALAASIDYIHLNPVKRGLCLSAIDWKWSSARFHIDGVLDSDLPPLIHPDPYWLDGSGVQTENG